MSRSNYQTEHSLFKNIKNYFYAAFNSSMTLHKFDFESVPKGYMPPLAYAMCISFTSAFLMGIFRIIGKNDHIEKLDWFFTDSNVVHALIEILLRSFIILAFGAFVVEIIICKSCGFAYNSKIFGMLIASFTPMPLVIPFIYFGEKTTSWVAFSVELFMEYYIRASMAKKRGSFNQRMHALASNFYGIFHFQIAFMYLFMTLGLNLFGTLGLKLDGPSSLCFLTTLGLNLDAASGSSLFGLLRTTF